MAGSTTVSKTDKVDPAQVLVATKALLRHIQESSKESTADKRDLFDEDKNGDGIGESTAEMPIWLTMTTKRHILDSRKLQPSKIVVPHPLNQKNDSTICLITGDPQRAFKNLVASDDFPAALRKRITRIIDLTHLTKKFKAYEQQRKLYAEHDIFLADARVISRLPKALGKSFYKSTVKRPIPVTLTKPGPRNGDKKKKKNTAATKERDQAVAEAAANARTPAQIAAEIERTIGAVYVHLSPTTNTAVKIGHAGWSAEDIAANVQATTETLVEKFVPQKWNNVKALFIKGPKTMAVPIWQTDELWLDGDKEVLKAGSEALQAYESKKNSKKEKANVGKKRKAVTEAGESEAKEDEEAPKKRKTRSAAAAPSAKKSKKAAVPESNDDGLDKKIAEHKEKLKKQKKAAKLAMDV